MTSKKQTVWSGILALLICMTLVFLSLSVFASCKGNKPNDSSNTSPSQGTSDSSSSTGGGNSSATDPEPGDGDPVRIPVTGTVRYDFDVVAGYGKITGKKYSPETGEGVSVSSEEGVGSWITGFTWKNEAQATLNIYSDKECTVDLGVKVRKTAETAVLTSKVSISIAGEVIESAAEVAKSDDGAKAEFDEVNLGRYVLSAGANEIKIIPMDSTDNFSFMSVIIYADDTEANLRWTDIKDVTGIIYYGINEKVVLEGDYKKSLSENCIGVAGYTGATAKFPIYSSRQAKAKISFITCSMSAPTIFTDFYNFSINGKRQHSGAASLVGGDWGDYGIVCLGEYTIEKGINEITLTAPADHPYTYYHNIRALIIDTDATTDWNEVAEEAHVCLNKCEVCGGCTDADCTEEACKTKCVCAKADFLAVDEKVFVTGGLTKSADKTYYEVADYSAFSTVTFKFTSEKQAEALLSFTVAGNPNHVFTFADYFRVWVNVPLAKCNDTDGADLKLKKTDYTAQTSKKALDDFYTVTLGKINLKEGENTVTIGFTCVGSVEYAFSIKGMSLQSVSATELIDSGYAHKCTSACAICGGCKNADCTETSCATKCACVEKAIVAYGNAVVEQGKYDDKNNLGCLTLDNNTWRTKFRYIVRAEKAGKAELSIIISSTTGGIYTATDVFMLTINGTRYTSEAKTVNDGIAWSTYHTIKLGIVELKEGENVLAFDHYHITDLAASGVTNWGESVNFQAIILNTSVPYVIGHDVCLDKCAICGGCKEKDCTEEVCKLKCTCKLNTFKGVDEKVRISSGLSKNTQGDYIDVTDLATLQTVTFKVNSAKAQKVNLGFTISNNPTASWTLVDYFRVWVNVPFEKCNDTDGAELKLKKTDYTAPTIQGDGSVFSDIMIGVIDLKEGENEITIGWTCVGSAEYKFTLRNMLMLCGADVTLVA